MGFAGHFGWDLPVKLNGIARSFSVGLSSITIGGKIILAAIIIRFLFAGVAFVCSTIESVYLEKYSMQAIAEIELVQDDIKNLNMLSEEIPAEVEEEKSWWQRSKDKFSINKNIEKFKTYVQQVYEKLKNLPDLIVAMVASFVFNCVLVPLLVLWLLKHLLSLLFGAAAAQKVENTMLGGLKSLHQKLDMRQYVARQ
jgi:hypothetical protein